MKFVFSFIAILTLLPFSQGFVISGTPIVERRERACLLSLNSLDRSTAANTSSMKYVNGIRELKDDYDIFLLDMWGVMHDGTNPYEGVLQTVKELKQAGKELVILSNSSKRTSNSIKMLRKLGFDPNDFDQIITSGEVSHQMLLSQPEHPQATIEQGESWELPSTIAEKKKVFVCGSGSEDVVYCESSGWELASVEEANLIIARGTFTICDGTSSVVDKKVDADEYERVLQESLRIASSRRLPMLITNPDKVRPDKGLPPMPGAIGDAYEALFDDKTEAKKLVKRIGKPFPDVYKMALRGRDPKKACMVGDALETDVTGGSSNGIDTIWVVKDGIHGPKSNDWDSFEEGTRAILDEFNGRSGTYSGDRALSPTAVLPHFRW